MNTHVHCYRITNHLPKDGQIKIYGLVLINKAIKTVLRYRSLYLPPPPTSPMISDHLASSHNL